MILKIDWWLGISVGMVIEYYAPSSNVYALFNGIAILAIGMTFFHFLGVSWLDGKKP